jgi:hypothetical protein
LSKSVVGDQDDEEIYGPVEVQPKKVVAERPKLGMAISKSAAVNQEEMVMQEFKIALKKKAQMTPEEFYRTID